METGFPAGARRPILVYVVTSPEAVRGLLRGQLRYLSEAGFEVVVVAPPGKQSERTASEEGARFLPVGMKREISLCKDLAALFQLLRILRRLQPAVVNAGTPKAGLLGGLAAWLAGVPCRVYTLYGLRLETARGWKRWALRLAELTSCRLADRVICVSESLRRRAVELELTEQPKTIVLASGSPNGIDPGRFEAVTGRTAAAKRKREDLGIPQSAPVVGFVGRLTRDKGIVELVAAFQSLRDAYPELRLLLVGPFEAGDPIPHETRHAIDQDPRILCTGFVEEPEVYYQVMDVFALPSHREGFPTVVLEAAAAGKPVVAAGSTGLVDAVVDGVTGILVPPGDAHSLASALALLLDDPALARRLAEAGRRRAGEQFRQTDLWRALVQFYERLLSETSRATPAGKVEGRTASPLS